MYKYFFGCFPVEEMKIIIIIMCVKKKRGGGDIVEICWAIAQLCHNTMGNCIVTQ